MTQTLRAAIPHKALPALYFVVGQIIWFACVISAAKRVEWVGELLAAALLVLHVARSNAPRAELKLVGSVAAIGFTWENVLYSSGLLAYPGSVVLHGVAPFWLLALWATFAAQLNATYGWLKPRLWMAVLLGAVAGPLSFRAGAALGAVQFLRPWPAALALAMGWAVLLPVAIALSRRWPGSDGGGPSR